MKGCCMTGDLGLPENLIWLVVFKRHIQKADVPFLLLRSNQLFLNTDYTVYSAVQKPSSKVILFPVRYRAMNHGPWFAHDYFFTDLLLEIVDLTVKIGYLKVWHRWDHIFREGLTYNLWAISIKDTHGLTFAGRY